MENNLLNDIPIIELKEHERLWMEEVYKRNKLGERFSPREVWSLLHNHLPKNFLPATLDSRLINSSGERLNVLGIIAVEKSYQFLSNINIVIASIRDILLGDPQKENIEIQTIANIAKLSVAEVSFIIISASYFGHFYQSSTSEASNYILKSINIGTADNIYYTYLHFQGIEQLIRLKTFESYRNHEEDFTIEDQLIFSTKIDDILEDLKSIKLGNEVIWTELNELKAAYNLSKKNWRQLLTGKLTEMVVGGVINDTVSKKIADFINPVISKFLTQ